MNVSKLLVILFVSLAVPAPATAQVIIERINEEYDPSAHLKKAQEGSGGDDANAEDEEEEEDEGAELSESEIQEVKELLLPQLKAMHTKCLQDKTIRRPELTKMTGTATWTVTKEGKATFSALEAMPVPLDMFFRSEKAKDAMEPSKADGVVQRGFRAFRECAVGEEIEVPFRDKEGDVTVSFKVTYRNDKAVVRLND